MIPKKSVPADLSECRNISCTSIFSKSCEAYMMEALTNEVKLDKEQFGGVKGSGAEHMLAELINDQMECLDYNRSACVHMSIDLEKAFNHMDHLQCIRSLIKLGASNQSVLVSWKIDG